MKTMELTSKELMTVAGGRVGVPCNVCGIHVEGRNWNAAQRALTIHTWGSNHKRNLKKNGYGYYNLRPYEY